MKWQRESDAHWQEENSQVGVSNFPFFFSPHIRPPPAAGNWWSWANRNPSGRSESSHFKPSRNWLCDLERAVYSAEGGGIIPPSPKHTHTRRGFHECVLTEAESFKSRRQCESICCQYVCTHAAGSQIPNYPLVTLWLTVNSLTTLESHWLQIKPLQSVNHTQSGRSINNKKTNTYSWIYTEQ